MGEVINFARYHRVVSLEGYKRCRRVEIAQESNYQEEPEPIVVSRFSARRDLHRKLDVIAAKLKRVRKSSNASKICHEELGALKPRIEEFYAYCPDTSAPFSPQASQSRASLTPEQFEHMRTLYHDLDALVARLTDLVPDNEK